MTSAQPPLEHGFAAVDAQEDPHTCDHANERGLLGAEDALAWLDAIDRAVASGRLLYAVTFFLAAGTRPSTSADRA